MNNMNNNGSPYFQNPCASCGNASDACSCQQQQQPIIRKMYRGDDFVFDIQVQKSPYPGTPPVPINITGYEMWCTVKRYLNDPDSQAVAQVTAIPSSIPAGGGIVFTDPLSGKAEITIPHLATIGFPDGTVRMPYDVQVKDTVGRIFTVEAGSLWVIPDVTRATT